MPDIDDLDIGDEEADEVPSHALSSPCSAPWSLTLIHREL